MKRLYCSNGFSDTYDKAVLDSAVDSTTTAAMHLNSSGLTITPQSYIDRIAIRDKNYEINLSPSVEESLFQKFLNKMQEVNFTPTVEHKCHNCGGSLEIKATEHIFKCPFCNSVYAIGTELVNDRG